MCVETNNIELLTIKYVVNDTSNVSSDVYSVLTNNNIALTDNESTKGTKAFYVKNKTLFSVVPNYRLMLHTPSINVEQNKGNQQVPN